MLIAIDRHMHFKYIQSIFVLTLISGINLYAQLTTFGDLIPPSLIPGSIQPTDILDCNRYFQVADSINRQIFKSTGMNPVPRYRGGTDTISYNRSSMEEALNDISLGAVLVRMIIDRTGSPVCCKVYMKGGDNPGKQIEGALSKLIFTPSYRQGQPVPTEYRFVYDFLAPKNPPRKIID